MGKKNKNKKDYSCYEDRAQLCPHFEMCGGCTLQKISYEKQLELKAARVEGLLRGVYGDFCFEGILKSPLEEGYRNKMEFTFGDECKGGPFALGLHKRGSFMDIVDVRECHLVNNDINIIRNAVREYFNAFYEEGKIAFHNNRSHKGWLRHLLVRRSESTGEVLAALVTDSDIAGGTSAAGALDIVDVTEQKGEGFAETRDETPAAGKGLLPVNEREILEGMVRLLLGLKLVVRISGILHIVNDSLADIVQSDRTEILYGNDFITEEVLGLKFRISVFSFFQTNPLGAAVLYSKAREYAAEGQNTGTLFDLYCGTGTISQLMSATAEKVVGVEIVKEAVETARKNAELNGITNTEFIAEDVLKAVDVIGKPDSLILDPPRDGINPKALGKILSWSVESVVYVSCKPESLARDLMAFKVAGYDLVKACCVDMFPQTENVETAALLINRNAKTKYHMNVGIDAGSITV